MKRSHFAVLFCAALSCSTYAVPRAWADNQPPLPVLPEQADAQKDITIFDTSLHLAPEGEPATVYFALSNASETAHLLTGVSSPVCQKLVGHHADQESTGGTRVLFTHLALPGNSTLVFPPGGYHLLCFGLSNNVRANQNVQFTFTFMGGSSKTVSIPVQDAGTDAESDHKPD
ncbi:copper chaperone PCu(A)C [Acetobacter ascendens]|uniref:Copper chaperone PCu(A)C n=1 Tax=Acetobacter ascendens TaxID=481146 RepID=A0A1D8QUT5_9PROT|nr:copper chaperone PCu(A)C [Acetobacter ascendens]RCL08544.1 hypothetical protein BBA71_03400 [Acetobacter pasteurianus]GCD74902.1 hypothetical protein NBRC3299_1194 [Acetobacter pasteurianus NBRC 3299]AOW46120.1 hypothetical protein A4S02_04245 [Acetobacter ascendens]AOW49852.1 hypothetical protein A4R89_11055 [Acetobacter ascendens]ARW11706.1 hypothetical protein S101447_02668 [Acetobacter ascendens]